MTQEELKRYNQKQMEKIIRGNKVNRDHFIKQEGDASEVMIKDALKYVHQKGLAYMGSVTEAERKVSEVVAYYKGK